MVSKRKSSRTGPSALKLLVMLSAGLTLCALLCLLSYILIKGVPHLTPSLFAWEYNTGNVSLLPSLLNTVIITIIPLAVSVPLGVCSAIYLCEYAKPGSQVVALIRIANETLAGIPSIVYACWLVPLCHLLGVGLFHPGRFHDSISDDSTLDHEEAEEAL